MMQWQDMAFTAGEVFFLIAGFPMVRSRDAKPPAATSFPTAIILVAFAVVHATLGLWAAATVSLASGALWGVVAVQRMRLDRASAVPN